MTGYKVFAQISGETIKNVMICDNYELANQLTREIYGSASFSIECTQYKVSIGDIFKNKKFYYNDGKTEIPYLNTAEEDVAVLKTQNTELTTALEKAQAALNEIILG